MRIAAFILRDMEAILGEWALSLRTQLPAARHLGRDALRDHAREILQAVASDISQARWPPGFPGWTRSLAEIL